MEPSTPPAGGVATPSFFEVRLTSFFPERGSARQPGRPGSIHPEPMARAGRCGHEKPAGAQPAGGRRERALFSGFDLDRLREQMEFKVSAHKLAVMTQAFPQLQTDGLFCIDMVEVCIALRVALFLN